MSFSLPPVSLSGAVVGTSGTVDWTSLAQSAGYGVPTSVPYLALLNESPCGLQIQFHTGEQMSLPAGGWQTIALNANCTSLTYKVLYVLNANPIVSSLLGTWYAPGEAVPDAPILGNSPIGASVSTSPFANALQGVNQLQAVTEVDRLGVFAGPILIPTSLTAALWLRSGDGTSTIILEDGNVLQIAASSNIFLNGPIEAGGTLTADGAVTVGTTLGVTGAVTLTNKITTYNNEVTAGVGVPSIVALAQETNVAVTTQVNIVQYAVGGSNVLLRISGWVRVNNSVSGNNCTFQVSYTDPSGTALSRNLPCYASGTAITPMDGATSTANNRYSAMSFLIDVKASTNVTVIYRDPTNTPSDTVSATIERLS